MQVRTECFAAFAMAALALALGGPASVPGTARAGGPLLLADPATRTPYAYGTFPVPVYTDLGPLGILGNATADSLAVAGFGQWSSVSSSSFAATVVGDLGALGLSDVDSTSAASVIGQFNGGGIHVLYDHDGSILRSQFGAPPGVLGISSPEFAVGNVIQESWVVLAGPEIASGDSAGVDFAGVFVHEFGHSINLAHSQTNGSLYFFADDVGPGLCATPYLGAPTAAQLETMYPFIDVLPGGTGSFVASVDHRDDRSTLAELYPGGGPPTATITGTLFAIDGVTDLTGINVIARDVQAPFTEAASAITGDFTQGEVGPDGLFTLQGLREGEYVLYIDELVAGTFSTPPGDLQAEEEFWDLAEAGDRVSDPACNYSTIVLGRGDVVVADIYANAVPPAVPVVTPSSVQLLVPEVTIDFTTLTLGNSAPVGSADLVWTVTDRSVLAKAEAGGRAHGAPPPRFSMARARAHAPPVVEDDPTPVRRAPADAPAARVPEVQFTSKLGGVLDGGFELGGVWSEFSLNFVTPICDLALCGSGFGSGPRSGNHWAWFGGLAGGFEEASLSQDVLIPAEGATLTFYLEQPVCDSAADFLEILVDGVRVFATDGTAVECGQLGYSLRTVDLAAFADGGLHTLELRTETYSANGGATNFFVDDVDIVTTACPWLGVFPQSGILAPGTSELLDLTVSTSGLAPGSYQCELLLESNAAVDSLLVIPVDLDVVGAVLMEVSTSAETSVSVYTVPDGSGSVLSAAEAWNGVPGIPPTVVDATVTVTLRDLSGAPLSGFPAEAVELVSSLGNLQPCPADTTADQDTDASGRTVFQLPRRAGGATDPEQDEVLQVEIDGAFVADAVYGDQVLYASDADGNLYVVDPSTGLGTFVCALPSNSEEIEYDKATGRAWVHESTTGYTLRRFSVDDCNQMGSNVFTGTTFTALEYIGPDLYGTASPLTCANSSLRILDPNTGAATVLGPTGRGPISGLAWDRASATLYGVTGCSEDVPTELVTINIYTGAATTVGLTGVSLGSLQFGPDGALYAGGDDIDGGNLYRIDPLTGQANLVGATGFSSVTGLTLYSPFGLDIQFNGPDLIVDGLVNLADLGEFASVYGSSYSYAADFRWDGRLDLADVGTLATALGAECALSPPTAPLDDSSSLAIWFERDGLHRSVDLEPGTWVGAHLVLEGPASTRGVRAWSGRIETSDNLETADWRLPDNSLNLRSAPDFLVGQVPVRSAVDDLEGEVLLSFRVRVLDEAPAEITVISLAEESAVQVVLDDEEGRTGAISSVDTRTGLVNAAGGHEAPAFVFEGYRLRAAPNPFNPSTTLHFDLPRRGQVAVDVYDMRGRHVRTLGPVPMDAGPGTLLWGGRDDGGHTVNSGVYLCRLHLDGQPVGEPIKINLIK